jgi:drug/metabolite transporter (DMT)-like permease
MIWNYGVKRIGSTKTAIYSNLTPVVAMIVAWPALGEAPTLAQTAGALTIFVSIYLVKQGTIPVANTQWAVESGQ